MTGFAHGFDQSCQNAGAGLIALDPRHTRAAMSRLTRQGPCAIFSALERRAQRVQRLDLGRSGFSQNPRRLVVYKARTRRDRVRRMQVRRIITPQRRRNAALAQAVDAP